MPLQALLYEEKGAESRFRLLDQRLLPLRTTYIDISGPEAGWKAIKVRSYPQDATLGTVARRTALSRKLVYTLAVTMPKISAGDGCPGRPSDCYSRSLGTGC